MGSAPRSDEYTSRSKGLPGRPVKWPRPQAASALREDQQYFVQTRDRIADFNEGVPKEKQNFDLGDTMRDRVVFLTSVRIKVSKAKWSSRTGLRSKARSLDQLMAMVAILAALSHNHAGRTKARRHGRRRQADRVDFTMRRGPREQLSSPNQAGVSSRPRARPERARHGKVEAGVRSPRCRSIERRTPMLPLCDHSQHSGGWKRKVGLLQRRPSRSSSP